MYPSDGRSPAPAPGYERHSVKHELHGSPVYPSPARSECETMNYSSEPHGLGLYNAYAMSLSDATSGRNPLIPNYPHSPQPTEDWSSGIPSQATDPTNGLWNTNECYYPTQSAIRSPMVWPQSLPVHPHTSTDVSHPQMPYNDRLFSHRSSISSSNDMSAYSREDSEGGYPPQVKIENYTEWYGDSDVQAQRNQRMDLQQPATVAPGHLLTPYMNLPPCGFPSQTISRQQQEQAAMAAAAAAAPHTPHTPSSDTQHQVLPVPPRVTTAARARSRRVPTTPETAVYTCELCRKPFKRQYNYKTHLETHDPLREYPHPCRTVGCVQKFVRRTDLLRHNESVHKKSRAHPCNACGSSFARKDTLKRHQEDGCSHRPSVKQDRHAAKQAARAANKANSLRK